jgi:hypothetical protein
VSPGDVQATNQQAGDRAHCGAVALPTQNIGGGDGGEAVDPNPFRYTPTCYYMFDVVDYYRYCECAESGCQCSGGSYRGLKYLGTEYYLMDYFCY